MHSEFLMGNEAIALGALASGVNLVCGYPGTPSTEVLETVAKRRGEGVYVEWSVNEKVAMEMAGGAAYAGARGISVTAVETVDPLDHAHAVETVRSIADLPGVKAVIFRSPCVALFRAEAQAAVDPEKCIGCKKCIREIGCPALSFRDGKVHVDPAQCNGCTLCAQFCPVKAIEVTPPPTPAGGNPSDSAAAGGEKQ